MRIYLPATLPLLAKARAELTLTDGPSVGFAVTPALREWYVEGDLEELEYAAMTAAARESLALLAADPSARRRRVVLAVDLPDAAVRPLPDGPREQLSILAPVPWSALASVHVDGFEAEPAVAAAAEAVQAAAGGDEDAQFIVDGAEDESLLWYAVQEADDLLAGGAGTLGDEGAGT
ncbi:MAG: hypothetical protein QOI76_4295 [Frankiales bacterium]|nr:hypothetical protein [Frankiales bacterium]